MDDLPTPEPMPPRVLALKLGLLALWAVASFGSVYFARDLDFTVLGWPLGYWIAAQGAVLVFIAIVAFNAWAMRRLQPQDDVPDDGSPSG